MKRTELKAAAVKNFENVIANFSETEILKNEELSMVRGGSTDGEANGGVVIIMTKF
jgi:hypothetical protein